MSTGDKGMFELWRQDDHGHRFLICCYRSRNEAAERLATLCLGQHKQTYWISEQVAEFEPGKP